MLAYAHRLVDPVGDEFGFDADHLYEQLIEAQALFARRQATSEVSMMNGVSRSLFDFVPISGEPGRPRMSSSATRAAGQRAAGYPNGMEIELLVKEVEEVETRSGKTRYVLRDDQGHEYTTFRPQIGREAARFEGRRARVEFHEEERKGFHNVYLDAISDASPETERSDAGTDPDEVAWSTAVEAAPWMLGSRDPEEEVPPEDLYEKLEPFKRLVAEDIRGGGEPSRED